MRGAVEENRETLREKISEAKTVGERGKSEQKYNYVS